MSMQIPRLEFDELDPALAALLESRVKRLGYLGEFFRVMGHQPRSLKGFVEFTEAAKAGLDKRLVELLALTVATVCNNAYERNQHERLSIRSGFGHDWVRSVESLAPETAAGLSDVERRLQAFALRSVKSNGETGQDEFDAVVRDVGLVQAVAILLVIARYVAHAYMVNTLKLAPPVPSIWADGFTG